MARYIDADAFEEFIKAKYKDGESTDDIKDQMLFDLSYQPTAFNMDAVVAELENGKMWKEFMIYDLTHREYEIIGKAIEIVRKGGAE